MPPTPSFAGDFYDRIVMSASPVDEIRRLFDSTIPQEETDWLDFKTLPDPDPKDSKLKSLWNEALCGFSNNMGGVLIWGVDARKNADNIDAARGEAPIKNPFVKKSRLIELQRNAVSPPIMNVAIEAYETAPGEGFIVCFVPEGRFKPYRTEDSKRQFHLRAGDNLVPMSTAMLRSMFYPQSHAAFAISAAAKYSKGDGEIKIEFTIKNVGNATSPDTYISLVRDSRQGPGLSSPTYQGAVGWDQLQASGMTAGFTTNRPLHPEISRLFWCRHLALPLAWVAAFTGCLF